MAPCAHDRRADRGRLARVVVTWGALAGLFAGTLLPTLSEPEPVQTPAATAATPIVEVGVVAPVATATAAAVPTPRATPVVVQAPPPAPPIDLAVAAQADAWLVRVQRGARVGSGVVVAADGLIVTSDEVVDGDAPIRVWLPDGQALFAEILLEDVDQALALLAVADATPAVAPLLGLTNTDEPVLLVSSGAAVGEPSVATRATLLAAQQPPGATRVAYRTDEPGQVAQAAGSPLLDQSGGVVGVATRHGQTGVAVPAERVLAFVQEGEATWRALSRGPVRPAASAAPGPGLPGLVGHSVEPPVAEPGALLTLTYDIQNPGPTGRPVLLGASVRREGVQAWTDDPANDAPVVVEPGRSVYRREFRLPAQSRSGWYEVAWSILSPDKSTGYAFETVARVLSVQSADAAASDGGVAQAAGSGASVLPQLNTPQVNVARSSVPPPAPQRASVPSPTPTVRRAAVTPPRPTATPRPAPKPVPTATPLPRRTPSPTPVRRR